MTQDTRARDVNPERADPELARRALQQWGDAVKREQLQDALERLESQGDVSPVDRRILEEMSTAIVEELLSGADAKLSAGSESGQYRTATIVDLFDCDLPPRSPGSTD